MESHEDHTPIEASLRQKTGFVQYAVVATAQNLFSADFGGGLHSH
jgi:hypothetical protein